MKKLAVIVVVALICGVYAYMGGINDPRVEYTQSPSSKQPEASEPVISDPVLEPSEPVESDESEISAEPEVSSEPEASEPIVSEPVQDQPTHSQEPEPEPSPEPSIEPDPEPEPSEDPEPAPSEDFVEIKDTETEDGEEAVDPSDKTVDDSQPYNGQISEDGKSMYLVGFGWVEISDDPDVGGETYHENGYVSGEQCPNAEW